MPIKHVYGFTFELLSGKMFSRLYYSKHKRDRWFEHYKQKLSWGDYMTFECEKTMFGGKQ